MVKNNRTQKKEDKVAGSTPFSLPQMYNHVPCPHKTLCKVLITLKMGKPLNYHFIIINFVYRPEVCVHINLCWGVESAGV